MIYNPICKKDESTSYMTPLSYSPFKIILLELAHAMFKIVEFFLKRVRCLANRIIMIEYQLPRRITKYSKCLSYPPLLSVNSNNQTLS